MQPIRLSRCCVFADLLQFRGDLTLKQVGDSATLKYAVRERRNKCRLTSPKLVALRARHGAVKSKPFIVSEMTVETARNKNKPENPGKLGRPRSDAARKAILDATFGLLTESQGAKLTVEGTAERAGVSKQTIYRWWKSAAHVAEEATKPDIKIQERNVDTGSLEGDLRTVLVPLVRRLDEATVPAVRTFLRASIDDPEFAGVFHNSIIVPFRQTLCDVIGRGISRGELPRDLNAGSVSEQILGAIIYRACVHVSVSDEAFIEGVIRSWVWPVSKPVSGGMR